MPPLIVKRPGERGSLKVPLPPSAVLIDMRFGTKIMMPAALEWPVVAQKYAC